MSNVEERLLAQIRENPADDAPRLVYADVLTARGDLRGEYIELALAYARQETSPEQVTRYLELDRQQTQWGKALGCDGFQVVRWRRGFPEVISAEVGDAARLAPLLRRLPFRGLILRHSTGDAAAFARMPELARIDSLVLRGPLRQQGREWKWSEFPIWDLEEIVGSPHWTSLRSVEFEEGSLTDHGAAIVARASWLPRLEELVAWRVEMTGEGFARMLARPLPHLRLLRLWEVPIGDAGAQAIARHALPALSSLVLGMARLTPVGGRAILGSRNLAAVTVLELEGNDLRGSLHALADAPALQKLTLEKTRVANEDLVALAAKHLPALVELDLESNSIGDAGAAALASSRTLQKLAKINLNYNQLTRDGVLPFTRTTLASLATLQVSSNPLPSGVARDVAYYDQGFEVGGATIDAPYSTDEIRAWFAAAGSVIRVE